MKIIIGLVIGSILGFGLASAGFNPLSTSTGSVLSGDKETIAGVSYAPKDWKTLSSGLENGWAFTAEYPRDFTVNTGEDGSGSSYLTDTPMKISFPEDSFSWEKTNFGEAWVAMDAFAGIPEKQCYTTIDDANTQMSESKKIGEVTYMIDHPAGGAAAGNYYDSTVYRYFTGDVCFEAVETVHTSNIYNYDPGTVTEFDKTQTQKIFDSILQTVEFTTTPGV